uniref:Uncharacterized protein n=1 Tax=Anguilla anguilla TaxID=7936 RepID=A0A0E9SWR4_ANGAN
MCNRNHFRKSTPAVICIKCKQNRELNLGVPLFKQLPWCYTDLYICPI